MLRRLNFMDVKTKLLIFRILKAIFYLLGLPLFVYAVLMDSMAFQNRTGFGDPLLPVRIAFMIWVFLAFIQIGISFFVKKQEFRTVIMVILILVTMLLPLAIIDGISDKATNEALASVDNKVSADDYEKLLADYAGSAGGLAGNLDTFMRIYNINMDGMSKGKNVSNTPEYEQDKDGNWVLVYDEEENNEYKDGYYGYADYSPNGMLAEGYVFSVPVAIEILIDYNEALSRTYYQYDDNGEIVTDYITGKPVTVSIDEAYAAAYEKAENSKAWQDYIATEEYKANEAEANKYRLTEERLDLILGALGANVGQTQLVMSKLKTLLGLVGGFLPENINISIDASKGYVELTIAIDGNEAVIALNETLSLEGIATALESFGLSAQALADLVSGLGLDVGEVTAETTIPKLILNLLNGIAWYDSPLNKPIYDFFGESEQEQALASYGRALYEGNRHGFFAGSVLIGDTLGNGDYSSAFGYGLSSLYQLKADMQYKPTVLPLLCLRDNLIQFAGIAIFMTIIFGLFSEKCRKLEEEVYVK